MIAAIVSLAAAAAPAVSQTPADGPLGRDEVLLEVEAAGTARVRAEIATVSVPLFTTAATPAAARALHGALQERVKSATRKVGIRPEDMRLGASGSPMGFVGNEAYEQLAGWSVAAGENQEAPQAIESQIFEIRLRDPRMFEALRIALEEAGVRRVPEPAYSLPDDRAVLRAAKADALRNARAEAEAYAQASGMRVRRMVRISERESGDLAKAASLATQLKAFQGKPRSPTPDYEASAVVSVDFVLGPE